MKKVLVVVLMLLCMFTLISCGDNKVNEIKGGIQKQDKEKEWVYDATYSNEFEYELGYVDDDGSNLAIQVQKFPFVNIDTYDAKQVNEEIKKYADSVKKTDREMPWYTDVSYKVYDNNDVLSILITSVSGGTAPEYYTYLAYNFDMSTGKKMTMDDILRKSNITKQTVVEQITTAENEKLAEAYDTAYIDTCYEQTITEFNKEIENKTVRMFFDSNKDLNVIAKFYIPADSGELEDIIIIK